VTLNKELDRVSLVSFPRDLYVYVPGWTMQRINTAHPHGGFEMTQDTFAYNFGLEPDYFVLINFWSFVQVIDNLGGINVNVAVSLTDQRDGHGDYTVPAGLVHMDGETALWYARSRYSSSDFERNRRQQEVLLGMFFRLISLNGLQRAPELYNLYVNNVVTNAVFTDLAPFLGLAGDVADDTSILSSYTIDRSHVTSYTTSAGAAVLLPNYDAIEATIRQALNVP
jgi:LCP family protein required for cell wall assembly